MNDARDIIEMLRFPAPYANKRRLMSEAATEIENLREMIEGYESMTPAEIHALQPRNVTPIGGPK